MPARVDPEALRTFVHDLFVAAGAIESDAQICADAFVLQELRDVQTHALRRLRAMVDGVKSGELNPTPERKVLSEEGATVIIDGDHGLGIPSAMEGMKHAVRLAKQYGIGFASVVNSNHFLAAAPYCNYAAEQGTLGMAFAGGGFGMAYPGTNRSSIGNSPLGYGVPTAAGFPIIFDSALTLSGGKLIQWAREGVKEVPAGFLGYDRDGNYTTDPAAISGGGVPLPIGLHKGAGLAVLVDILSGILCGSSFLRRVVPEDHPEWKRTSSTHAFIAIDIERFMPVETFKERMAAYVTDMKSNPIAPDYDEILLPGERAGRAIEQRSQGIPLHDEVVERLTDLSERYGVPLPDLAAEPAS